MRALIAEDDVAVASFVRKGLEDKHYAVESVTMVSRRAIEYGKPWLLTLAPTTTWANLSLNPELSARIRALLTLRRRC
jgi:hypothetical protein